MSRFAWLLAPVVAAVPAAILAQSPTPDAVFPSAVDVVTVDVLVLDEQGNPVKDLRAEDFVIEEDGRRQAVVGFEAVDIPESAPTAVASRTRISTNAPRGPAASAQRSFVIVFDDANLTPLNSDRARAAISDFIRTGLRPGDEVVVVPTSGGAWWTGRIPADEESLVAYVQTLDAKFVPESGAGRIWDHEAKGIVDARNPQLMAQVARRYYENGLLQEITTGRESRQVMRDLDIDPGVPLIRMKATEVLNAARQRLDASLETMTRVTEALGRLRGRKNLLLVSEGFIMDPQRSEFRELIEAAGRANAVVHFIDARGPGGFVGQAGMAGGSAEFGNAVEERDTTTALAFTTLEAEGARSIAVDTGGTVVPGTAGLGRAMKKIADESRFYYLLAYNPTNAKRDGKYRKIKVQVNRPGVEVRARRGYYTEKPGDGDAEPDELHPDVRAGLDVPGVAELPLRMTSYVFGPARDGKLPVLLVGEVDVKPLRLQPQGGRLTGKLQSYVVVHGRDGKVEKQETVIDLDVPADRLAELQRSGIAVRREFLLPPGAHQARLLVRDAETGRVGSVSHTFEVPAADAFRTSTPILTEVMQPLAPGQPPRPIPVAHREFAPGQRLAYAYEVYGAPAGEAGAPSLVAGYVVKRSDGTEISSGPPAPLRAVGPGQPAQLIVFTVPPGQPGEYEVLLTVRDEASGRTLEVSDPFVVRPPAS